MAAAASECIIPYMDPRFPVPVSMPALCFLDFLADPSQGSVAIVILAPYLILRASGGGGVSFPSQKPSSRKADLLSPGHHWESRRERWDWDWAKRKDGVNPERRGKQGAA